MVKQILTLAAFVAGFSAAADAAVVEDAFFDYSTATSYSGWKSDMTNLEIKDGALVITNDERQANFWDIQYFIAQGLSLTPGQTYTIDIDMEAVGEGTATIALGDWGNLFSDKVTLPAEQSPVSMELVCHEEAATGQFVLMQSGDFVGTIRIKSVRISHEERNLNPDYLCLKASDIVTGENTWDNQISYTLPAPLKAGQSYTLSIDVSGDAEGGIDVWLSDGASTQYGVQSLSAGTAGWRSQSVSFTAEYAHTSLQFCFGKYPGTTLYFDNVSLTATGSEDNLVENGDFSTGSMRGWGKPGWHTFKLNIAEYGAPELPPADEPMNAVKPLMYTNPLSALTLCADPTAVEYNGRLYVYGTCDQQEYDYTGGNGNNTYGHIKKLTMFSTADMVNWTHHGEIDMAQVCGPWLAASWAPSIVSREEADGLTHFYMYFSNSGGGIGVITSTSPVGPWTSPLDHPLISGSTPGLGECTWPFDPGVVIDGDGTGWLAFGGGDPNSTGSKLMPGNTRIVKLGADMVSLASDITPVKAPYHLEANELNYIGGKFVLSYSTSWGDRDDWAGYNATAPAPSTCSICYVTSDNPLDPESWKWGGEILKNPGTFGYPWGNNHTHLNKFGGKYYMIYHTQVMEQLAGVTGGYRSIAVNEAEVDENSAAISPVTASNKASLMIETARPSAYARRQAETMSNGVGVKILKSGAAGNCVINEIKPGAWVCVDNVDFGSVPAQKFTARICGNGKLDVYLDKLSSAPVATLEYSSKDLSDATADVVGETVGVHRVFFVFSEADHATRFDEWQFAGSDGIGEVSGEREVVSREYYSISGVRMAAPHGVCIERVRYSDGTIVVNKKITVD